MQYFGKRKLGGVVSSNKMARFGNQTLTLDSQGIQRAIPVLTNAIKASTGSKGSVDKYRRRVVRKLISKPEVKNVDNYYQFTFSGVGTATLLNGMTIGTDASTRIGRQVVAKSIQMRGVVTVDAAVTVPVLYRLICFYDSQSNGTAPAASAVLADATNVLRACTSPYNLGNSKRFKILWDHTDTLDSGQGTSNFESFYSGINKYQQFAVTSNGNITDITTGAVHYMLFCTGALNCDFFWRYRYTDA